MISPLSLIPPSLQAPPPRSTWKKRCYNPLPHLSHILNSFQTHLHSKPPFKSRRPSNARQPHLENPTRRPRTMPSPRKYMMLENCVMNRQDSLLFDLRVRRKLTWKEVTREFGRLNQRTYGLSTLQMRFARLPAKYNIIG
jgi:hypothetical protein